jgi:branched-chain amino acid aminotransferase
VWEGGEAVTPVPGEADGNGDQIGPVAGRIRSALLDIQYGRAEDTHGWMRRLA